MTSLLGTHQNMKLGMEYKSWRRKDKTHIQVRRVRIAMASKAIDVLVSVDPKPRRGLVSKILDSVELIIVKLGYDSSKPSRYLSGNYAPVNETSPSANLSVVGVLPACLNGEFLQIGPNPMFPPVAGYHWFDGDGMVHALRIKNGKATYFSRYVRTSRLKQEELFKGSKFLKMGDLKGLFGLFMAGVQMLRGIFGVLDYSCGIGQSNTALIFHQGKLLALSEVDKPYVLKILEDGDLETLGMLDYGKKLNHSFTAHPKVDPLTGEMFIFGCAYCTPFCTYRVISKDGIMNEPVPITMPAAVLMHDFAITENHSIFMDLPFYFKPMDFFMGNKLGFSFDTTKNACFGILPRYSKNELQIKWFELPNCFIFHNANAWEEGEEVVLITVRFQNPDLETMHEHSKDKVHNYPFELYEMRFNMKTGLASQKKLSASSIEFPRINENYTGRKQRFVYATMFSEDNCKITGIIKFDLQAEPETGLTMLKVGGNIQGIFHLGAGRYGSDAVFVPRVSGITSEEDDGYLIFFLHDENTGKSEVNVIDAKTMSSDPVAVVELPARVPYGFHALFVTEEQLKEQGQL